ncbi:hypothetical protein AALD01_04045 [Oscillospiraceae bacterium 21-37]
MFKEDPSREYKFMMRHAGGARIHQYYTKQGGGKQIFFENFCLQKGKGKTF